MKFLHNFPHLIGSDVPHIMGLCPTEAAGLQTSSQQELRGCLLQDAGAAMAALNQLRIEISSAWA